MSVESDYELLKRFLVNAGDPLGEMSALARLKRGALRSENNEKDGVSEVIAAGFVRRKVPGGWIYTTTQHGSAFVPDPSEDPARKILAAVVAGLKEARRGYEEKAKAGDDKAMENVFVIESLLKVLS